MSNELNYRHELKIGIGLNNHFYTLREAYPHYSGGEVLNGVYTGSIEIRYGHVQNLSQNAEEAVAKAKELAALKGLPLQPVTAEELQGQLAEIHRATAEQIAERVRKDEMRQAEYEAYRENAERQFFEVVAAGFCPIGQFAGQHLSQIDRGYATWLMEKRDGMEPGGLMRAIADKVADDFPELRLPVPDPAAKLGEPKQRMDFEATITRLYMFDGGMYGPALFCTMVTDDGVCLLSKSGAWHVIFPKYGPAYTDLKPGQRVKFKATVKEHKVFRDQMQTVIQRIKETA